MFEEVSQPTAPYSDCLLCQGIGGDTALLRVHVWEDTLWRLTVSLAAEVLGFAYLEPKRHIRSIAELDGEEARTFGAVIARVTSVLREVTEAELVYVYIFGDGIPHLHVHLAPHRSGDALSVHMIRGDIVEERLPGGGERYISKQFPPLSEAGLRDVAEQVQQRLATKY